MGGWTNMWGFHGSNLFLWIDWDKGLLGLVQVSDLSSTPPQHIYTLIILPRSIEQSMEDQAIHREKGKKERNHGIRGRDWVWSQLIGKNLHGWQALQDRANKKLQRQKPINQTAVLKFGAKESAAAFRISLYMTAPLCFEKVEWFICWWYLRKSFCSCWTHAK